jgi:hypothetical protein
MFHAKVHQRGVIYWQTFRRSASNRRGERKNHAFSSGKQKTYGFDFMLDTGYILQLCLAITLEKNSGLENV